MWPPPCNAVLPSSNRTRIAVLGNRSSGRDRSAEPGVADRDRAVVHRMAEIRDDEREVGQAACSKIRSEPCQRDDLRPPARTPGDVLEVRERVVLLRVAPVGAAEEARRGKPLGVCLPGLSGRLERVGEVRGRDGAGRAVGGDPVGRSRDESEVVRQARVRDAVVARQPRVAPRVRVERRSGAIAEHAARFLVLEDHHDHVVERRDRDDDGRGRCRNGQRRHDGCDEVPHAVSARRRQT